MIRLDGNAILIADPDTNYGMQLAESLSVHGARCFTAEHISDAKVLLQKYDFDLVISNYFLSDGIIHQLIDWSTKHLSILPIFTCLGYPYSSNLENLKGQSIAEVFSKSDSRRIIISLSRLLFDFNTFQENLEELISPSEILIELHISGDCFVIKPIEITEDSLYLHVDEGFSKGTFGILKFSILSGRDSQNFLIPGHLEQKGINGQQFSINPKYLQNWGRFLSFLNVKQLNITNFLN